jgi:hypothetical protein
MDPIIAWAVSIMLGWAPVGKSRIKAAIETPEDGRARYLEIATAATKVAYDPDVQPLFGGPRGRAATLALMLSVAWHESGFRRDVDLGIGKLSRGSGKDSCLLQIRVGAGKTPQGWSHDDLVSDREKCFRAGLAVMKKSFGACRALDQRDWLGVYTRGACVPKEPYSRTRMTLARKATKPPIDDAKVMAKEPAPQAAESPSAKAAP